MTVASGRWMSEPIPRARAAGMRPMSATLIIIRIGRSCVTAPSITARRSRISRSCRSRFTYDTSSTPLMTATPKSEMNPTPADTEKLMPRIMRNTTPPTSANGTFISTTPACSGSESNRMNSTQKMSPIVIGMTSVSRFLARVRFSNCPPHSMVYPSGSFTCAATFSCASATKLPWSRSRTLVRTPTCRRPSSRAMIVCPGTERIRATWLSGTFAPPALGTRMLPIASGLERCSRV